MNSNIPHLTNDELNRLWDLREDHPRQFYSNVTKFLSNEMKKYIYHNQVFRLAIMGETRSGKSEAAQSLCFFYTKIYNDALKNGYYNDRGKHVSFINQIQDRLNNAVKVEPLKFNVDKIMASRSDYLYKLREITKEKSIVFGQIWQIDENRQESGLGSYTAKQEMDNLNNIIAKFCQCEIWIQPGMFTQANTPYGIKMFKKDYINRCNWGLLYKIEMTPSGVDYKFMGWVKINLHKNEKHRHDYEVKKNNWIKAELEGSIDPRMKLRHEVAEKLSHDVSFCQLNKKATNFLRTKKQHIALLENWIVSKKCQNFNELEKDMIVDIARDKAYSRIFGDTTE